MGKMQLPDLSKAEWDLMNVMWRRKQATVAEVCEDLSAERGWTHNTVKTMLQRLEKKGYLLRDATRHAHLYQPAVRRRQVVRRALATSLDKILDAGFGPLVAYAAERKGLSDEEIAALRKLLEKEEEDD
jgi:BlaI family penicillinase repressor